MSRPPQEQGHHEPPKKPGAFPLGTLMVVAAVLLTLVWMWMLVLGVQQGRA